MGSHTLPAPLGVHDESSGHKRGGERTIVFRYPAKLI